MRFLQDWKFNHNVYNSSSEGGDKGQKLFLKNFSMKCVLDARRR